MNAVVALLPYDPDDYPPGPPDRCYGCWLLNSHQNSEASFEHLASGRRWCHACIEGLVSWEYDGVVEWANEGYPDDPTHIEWAGLTSWKPPADDERWPPEWLIAGADQHE